MTEVIKMARDKQNSSTTRKQTIGLSYNCGKVQMPCWNHHLFIIAKLLEMPLINHIRDR